LAFGVDDEEPVTKMMEFRGAWVRPHALAVGLLMAAAAAAAPVPPAGDVDAATVAAFDKDGSQWPSGGGDYSERRYSPLKQIDTKTVGRLGFAWQADMNTDRGLEATPIVVGGVMYVSSTFGQAFAFDAVTGRTLWSYHPVNRSSAVRHVCCDIVNRGLAVWKGRVYVATLDGHLVALDAASGKVDWSIDTIIDHDRPYSIVGPVLAVNGRVIVGNSGGDDGTRGYVTAYDTETGKELWRFYTVPKGPRGPFENADEEAAAKTWPADDIWTDTGGGSVWGEMSFDPKLNLLYFGTGNTGPWKHERPDDRTDDLYITSIVALNADTGRVAWHYQEVPSDRWDYDADSPITLADIKIGGRLRQVVLQAPKDGFFYVLDRKTGELLSAERYGAVNWASGVDMKTGRPIVTDYAYYNEHDRLIYPNGNGAHDWFPQAYSPKTGLIYIPAQDNPTSFSKNPAHSYIWHLIAPPEELAKLTAGQPHVDIGGFLRAWDPVAHKVVWQVRHEATWNGSVLATAGDLVFQPTQDGYFNAYDARTGALLKRLFTGNAAIAGAMTYMIGGTQYIALASGYGGALSWRMAENSAARIYENQGRMLAFKLDGGDVPPPPKREKAKGPPVVDTSGFPPADPELMARGQKLYGHCAGCHGRSGSAPNLPNLERVHGIGFDGFRAILLGGALEPLGMPNFTGRLSEDDVKALYEFVSRGAQNKPSSIHWN
jgi:quinohemoprotein ethanol dehydrogenase